MQHIQKYFPESGSQVTMMPSLTIALNVRQSQREARSILSLIKHNTLYTDPIHKVEAMQTSRMRNKMGIFQLASYDFQFQC